MVAALVNHIMLALCRMQHPPFPERSFQQNDRYSTAMPTRADRRPVRERLLDAADALFYRDGISRTGVDAVLAEAQVSTATLYAQFGGKDGLIAAYLNRRLE